MTNLDNRRIEIEELALSNDAQAVLDDDWQITEADVRELTAYAFDSDDLTWVGIGSSRAPQTSAARRFASADRTLVGLGP
ncbi:MAG TPA: hypothetical protein VEQ58_05230, partial [Polyangiaceae bacterium]|nr:hypothetical protein [Polyangiaceae bacterium]